MIIPLVITETCKNELDLPILYHYSQAATADFTDQFHNKQYQSDNKYKILKSVRKF